MSYFTYSCYMFPFPLLWNLFSFFFTFPDKVSRNFGIEYMLEPLQTNLASKMSYGFLKNFISFEGTFYFAVQTRDAVLAKSYALWEQSRVLLKTDFFYYTALLVNVDFVTFEYVLLIKYQSMSIWEFNLPIKQHNLIAPRY